MILQQFTRTELLIGSAGLKKLAESKVAVFGIGGVGSFVVEALARCGVGSFILIDDDEICLSNVNRQLHATLKTVGRSKVEVMKERILEINSQAAVHTVQKFYLPETAEEIFPQDCDYIVDAIDTVTAKIDLIVRAKKLDIPVISSMGAGNKLDPTRFEVTDLYKTSVCPLAKVLRRELKARGVNSLKVVYSKEQPLTPVSEKADSETSCLATEETQSALRRRQTPGSISFVPSVAGLIAAGEVVKDILKGSGE